ncbi:MAG TPA: glycosyltransferase family 39 protein [Candidatus Dormibacteraeota bacterium]|nr:glycosyltransferase family 39 protein [Candidatus Dormibacteraeota bacterium]
MNSSDSYTAPVTRPPWAVLGLLVAAKVGITMAVADRYGWHRDELYYLASSRHLSLGYVDYPPITPLLARLDQAIFPGSLPGLRLLTVLAGAAVIVIAALIARELGGGRGAQALAGLAVLISPMFIGANILFQTVSFDQLTWAAACLVFIRLLRGADPREWLLLGLLFGIGLETKYTIVGLGVALLVGLVATPARRQLRSRWPWLGFGLAILLLVPNLIWQVGHGWDSIAYTLHHRGSTDGPVFYWVQQLLLAGPQLLPIIVMGVVWLWRREPFRAAAVAIIAVELVFFAAGGKAYYPAPIYPLAYAAGILWFVEVVHRRWAQRAAVAGAVALTLLLLPLGLPVLPAQTMADSGIWKARKDFADMYGWPELAQQVTSVYAGLPLSDRSSIMILTSNYGEAGALDFYGRRLPPVVSPHLTYYYWAPAHMAPATVIAVGYPRSDLAPLFGRIELAGTIANDYGLHNEEYGQPIWVCRIPLVPLDQAWPKLKSVD